MEEDNTVKHKSHRKGHSGRKAEKKKAKNVKEEVLTAKQKNPKAFAFNSSVKAERRFRRKEDIQTKKLHIPLVDRTPLEPPPIIVAVVGPPKVGKTTLIQCLIKSFVRQPLTSIKGPVTLVSGKRRRITIMECNNDINSMVDIAKVADLVLLLIDASFGFEMEIFEFLNICQVHGMPRIMGILTHLDMLKRAKQVKQTKKLLKHRFWTEVYAGAKLFYLSGILHGEYLRNEVKNLCRFISVMKFRPLTWRTSHPYVLVDRMEDLTSQEIVRQNPKVDRTVCLYGYVRGVPLSKASRIHIPGCGDTSIQDVTFLPDPCPLPDKLKKRSLIEKERLIYAPFSGVGGVVYDKDAVYVELGGSHSHKQEDEKPARERSLVTSILNTEESVDAKLAQSKVQLFKDSTTKIKNFNIHEEIVTDEDGRHRRKAVFLAEESDITKKESVSSDDESDSGDETDSEEEEECDRTMSKENVLNSDSESESDSKRTKSTLKCDDSVPPWEKNSYSSDILGKVKSESETPYKKQKVDHKIMSAGSDSDNSGDSGESDEDVSDSFNDNEEVLDQLQKNLSFLKAKSGAIKPDTAQVSSSYKDTSTFSRKRKASEIDGSNDNKDSSTDIHTRISSVLSKFENSSKPKQIEPKLEGTSDGEDSSDESSDADDQKDSKSECESDDTVSEMSDDEDVRDESGNAEESALKWKDNLAKRAAEAFTERQGKTMNLFKLVYGTNTKGQTEEVDSEDDEEEIGGLFRVANRKQQEIQKQKLVKDMDDCSKFPREQLKDWDDPEIRELIRDCFVTGKWKSSEDAEELLRMDDLDDNDEDDMFGDFEDLETGETHVKNEQKDEKPVEKDEKTSREKLAEKKRKLKERFDAEYDEQGGDKSYYEELKREVDYQAQLNKNEFEGLDDSLRVQLEGFRPGMYVRVEIEGAPSELVENFDPTYPLIIGGLQMGEENIGCVQVRLKKHRWYDRILKSQDPLIISLGWRRFQTLPLFSKLEDNLRHRMMKYTPQHVACMAHFWGPITPQNTGFLAFQDISTKQAGFRIAATGAVIELDKSTHVTKKLKLMGTPYKIFKKSAFIKGMFTSTLEVAKFEGAKIRTVSGIRGQIKKAESKPEGSFRATFEDKILLSDIVFCRTWYGVEVSKFYNPVTNLLLPPEGKSLWQGMKTQGQLKRERGIKGQIAQDSLYTPIERDPKVFRPLIIPQNLQRQLPYKDKPKLGPLNPKKSLEGQRVAVVRDAYEEKVAKLMKMVKTTYADKQEKLKAETSARMAAHKKQLEKEEEKRLARQKVLKRQVFRALSKLERKQQSGRGRGGISRGRGRGRRRF